MSNAILFKNNNLNVKFNREDIKDFKSGYSDFIFEFSELVFWKDVYFVGEEFCHCYESANYLYNTNRDVFYIITASDIERLKEGYSVKFKAFTESEDFKKELDPEFFND